MTNRTQNAVLPIIPGLGMLWNVENQLFLSLLLLLAYLCTCRTSWSPRYCPIMFDHIPPKCGVAKYTLSAIGWFNHTFNYHRITPLTRLINLVWIQNWPTSRFQSILHDLRNFLKFDLNASKIQSARSISAWCAPYPTKFHFNAIIEEVTFKWWVTLGVEQTSNYYI